MARRVTPMRGKSRHHVLSREGGLEVLHRDHFNMGANLEVQGTQGGAENLVRLLIQQIQWGICHGGQRQRDRLGELAKGDQAWRRQVWCYGEQGAGETPTCSPPNAHRTVSQGGLGRRETGSGARGGNRRWPLRLGRQSLPGVEYQRQSRTQGRWEYQSEGSRQAIKESLKLKTV